MSAFGSRFATASWPILSAQFGKTVTLHSDTRDDVSVTAIVEPAEGLELEDPNGGRYIEQRAKMTTVLSDVTNANYWSSVTVGTTVWRIDPATTREDSDLDICEYTLIRTQQAEISRVGYRGGIE